MAPRKRKPVPRRADNDEAEGFEVEYDYGDIDGSQYSLDGGHWPSYQRVDDRKRQAEKRVKELERQGEQLTPVIALSRNLATTFWGQAWCKHLATLQDYETRLPRGRSYLRNGSVLDLKIFEGQVTALVSGSELYEVEIKLKKLAPPKWKKLTAQCARQIGSVVELLSGKISAEVMSHITAEDAGLFPSAKEIGMSCTCPDWATMCKHVAAVLYGVGVRLDEQPELFFLLRGVDHNELIRKSGAKFADQIDTSELAFNRDELEALFGIELDL